MNPAEMYKTVLQNCPEILSITDVSKILGVSDKTVYKLVKNGSIASTKVGRSHRIAKPNLLSYLKVGIKAM